MPGLPPVATTGPQHYDLMDAVRSGAVSAHNVIDFVSGTKGVGRID